MSLASLGVGSYEWGSVSGLMMMLVTCTRLPPSWPVMLPQKFSAATTSTLDAELPAVPVPPPPQAAAATSSAAATSIFPNIITLLQPGLRRTGRAYHWCNSLVQLVGASLREASRWNNGHRAEERDSARRVHGRGRRSGRREGGRSGSPAAAVARGALRVRDHDRRLQG